MKINSARGTSLLNPFFFAANFLLLGSAGHLQADCLAPPSGLVAWWQGEGNANDYIGANNASLATGATFSPGEVGQSFFFDRVQGYVQVPDSPSLSLTNEFTIELWYKDTGLPAGAYGGVISSRGGGGPRPVLCFNFCGGPAPP